MRWWWLACLLLVPLAAGGDIVYKRGSDLAGTFGIEGNVMTDKTLQYITGLRDLPLWADGPTYYFSDSGGSGGDFTTGSDSNTCGKDDPCTSWNKMRTVCEGANCILDAGDAAWMAVGASQVWTVNTADDLADDRIIVNVRSSRPGTPVVIDASSADGILVHATDNAAAGSDYGGVIVFQDITVASSPKSVWAIDDGVNFVGLNLHVTPTAPPTRPRVGICGSSTAVAVRFLPPRVVTALTPTNLGTSFGSARRRLKASLGNES